MNLFSICSWLKLKNLYRIFSRQMPKCFFSLCFYWNKFHSSCVCKLKINLELNIFEKQVLMKAKNIFVVVCLSLFLSSCSMGIEMGWNEVGNTYEDESPLEAQAEIALENFYTFLNQKQYDLAVELYGGSYEVLRGYNPSLDEENKEGFLRAACELNGFMCLKVLSAELVQAVDQGEFTYEVKFANPDGSEFILGPCCGASEEEMPPISIFTVHVKCEDDGSCFVMDLPPYVP